MPSNSLVETTINGLSPVIYWKMNETSGTTLAQSGSATTASISLSGNYTLADAELISGDPARFITFETDGKGTASKGNFVIPLEETTISFFIKINADFIEAASAPYVFSLAKSGESSLDNFQSSVKFNAPSSRKIATFYESGTGGDNEVEHGLIFPGNFYDGTKTYHIAVTKGPSEDSSVLKEKVYVNGILKFISNDTNATGTNYPNGGGDVTTFFINTQPDNRSGLNVSLGHFSIWRRVLTHDEVFSIAEAAGLNDFDSIEYPLDSASLAYWGSYQDIQDVIKINSLKNLLISLDPLVNSSVINPEESYETVEI